MLSTSLTTEAELVNLILFTVLEIEGIGVAAHQAGIQAIIPKSEAWTLIGNIEHLTGRQM
jgi:hypothetical protein